MQPVLLQVPGFGGIWNACPESARSTAPRLHPGPGHHSGRRGHRGRSCRPAGRGTSPQRVPINRPGSVPAEACAGFNCWCHEPIAHFQLGRGRLALQTGRNGDPRFGAGLAQGSCNVREGWFRHVRATRDLLHVMAETASVIPTFTWCDPKNLARSLRARSGSRSSIGPGNGVRFARTKTTRTSASGCSGAYPGWQYLTEEIKAHEALIGAADPRAGTPQLVEAFGIGPHTAAEVLIVAGDLDEELVSVLHAVMRDGGFVSFPAATPDTRRQRKSLRPTSTHCLRGNSR